MNNKTVLKQYYYLTKPGIIRGNLIVAIAAFLLGSDGSIDVLALFGLSLGTTLIIASACTFNNYYDRQVDKLMSRTAKRALVTGGISIKNALIFGTVSGVTGLLFLLFLTNTKTAIVGLIGWVSYVWVYTFFKKKTSYGTLIGSISGATPPLAGYLAATNELNLIAALLFLILVAWQMPHFYAIAIYRKKDYKNAHIPVSSITKGNNWVVREMLVFVVLFTILCFWLFVKADLSLVYIVLMIPICLFWLAISFHGLTTKLVEKWSRKTFFVSLIALVLFSLSISVESFIK